MQQPFRAMNLITCSLMAENLEIPNLESMSTEFDNYNNMKRQQSVLIVNTKINGKYSFDLSGLMHRWWLGKGHIKNSAL